MLSSRKQSFQTHWPVVVGIILLAALIRLLFLDMQNIAFDESFSLAVGSTNWPLLFQAILSDGVHPPLFYALHKVALSIWGNSEFGQRFMAAVFSLLGLPILYQLGKRLFNPSVGLLAMLLLALNPLHVWFSQEARMYSLLSMLVTLSMIFFWEALNKNNHRAWFKLMITNALIFLIHYFGLLVPVAQLSYLLLTFNQNYKHLRLWTLSQIGAGIFLVPWLVATFLRPVQSFGIGFLVRPTLQDLPLSFWNLLTGINSNFVSALLTLIFFGIAFVVGLFFRQTLTRQTIKRPQLLLLCWGVGPVILVWVMSQRRSFYADRYFSFCIPALLLLASYGTFRLSSSFKRNAVASGLILVTVLGLVISCRSLTYQKDDWRGAASYVATHQQPQDVILLRSLHIKFVFDYYHGRTDSIPATINLEERDVDELTQGALRAWLVYPYTRRPTHYPMQPLTDESVWELDLGVPRLLKQWFAENESNIIDNRRFLGVQVWLIDLNP